MLNRLGWFNAAIILTVVAVVILTAFIGQDASRVDRIGNLGGDTEMVAFFGERLAVEGGLTLVLIYGVPAIAAGITAGIRRAWPHRVFATGVVWIFALYLGVVALSTGLQMA